MDEGKKAFRQDREGFVEEMTLLLLLLLELFRLPGPNQSQSEVYGFNMKLPGLSDLTGQTMKQGQRRLKGCYLPWREVVTLKGLDTTSQFH